MLALPLDESRSKTYQNPSSVPIGLGAIVQLESVTIGITAPPPKGPAGVPTARRRLPQGADL